jgi:hypothetical protein
VIPTGKVERGERKQTAVQVSRFFAITEQSAPNRRMGTFGLAVGAARNELGYRGVTIF